MDISSVISDPQQIVYTPCYCEENVWNLCHKVKVTCSPEELEKCYAVFISNANKQIPLWHQKASKNEQRLVIWDYHVIVVYADPGCRLVYDLDTELSFPCSFVEYVDASIGEETLLKNEFWRQFRVLSAEDYLSRFASDRSHMLKDDGSWIAPAPTYSPIRTTDCTNNLQDFISMEKSNEFGTVFNLQDFRQHFLRR